MLRRRPAGAAIAPPGGEIRGFVVPEPATLGLAMAGLAAAALGLRRRRQP